MKDKEDLEMVKIKEILWEHYATPRDKYDELEHNHANKIKALINKARVAEVEHCIGLVRKDGLPTPESWALAKRIDTLKREGGQ